MLRQKKRLWEVSIFREFGEDASKRHRDGEESITLFSISSSTHLRFFCDYVYAMIISLMLQKTCFIAKVSEAVCVVATVQLGIIRYSFYPFKLAYTATMLPLTITKSIAGLSPWWTGACNYSKSNARMEHISLLQS